MYWLLCGPVSLLRTAISMHFDFKWTCITKSLPVLEFARENGIIMLLPPHTMHRLQPLDVGFFKPLQTYYDRYIDCWLKSHAGCVFTEYQVGEAFLAVYV